MRELYRVAYGVTGRDAQVVEVLEVLENVCDEIADRLLWYEERYGAPVEVKQVVRVLEKKETYAVDHNGVPLCWFCLGVAVAKCFMCGDCCCPDHACPMRVEVRGSFRLPAGELAIECLECVCK